MSAQTSFGSFIATVVECSVDDTGEIGTTINRYSYVWNPEVDKDPAGNFIVVWQRSTSDPDLLGDDDDQQIRASQSTRTRSSRSCKAA